MDTQYVEVYKYVFIFSNDYVITIEAENKVEAIKKIQEGYESLFEKNFQVYKVNRSITGNKEFVYL